MKTRVLRAGEGEILGSPLGCRDRFLVDSKDWGGNLGVVEHLLAPHAIAAPLHRHTKEDEFSLILEGRVWFVVNDEEHVAEPGDLRDRTIGCEGDFEATSADHRAVRADLRLGNARRFPMRPAAARVRTYCNSINAPEPAAAR